MPLTPEDKAAYAKLSASDRQPVIKEQLQRIRVAVNDGSLDKAGVNDALERLDTLNKTDSEAAKDDIKASASTPPYAVSPAIQPNPAPVV